MLKYTTKGYSWLNGDASLTIEIFDKSEFLLHDDISKLSKDNTILVEMVKENRIAIYKK